MESSVEQATLEVQEASPVEDKLAMEETAVTETPTPNQLEVHELSAVAEEQDNNKA